VIEFRISVVWILNTDFLPGTYWFWLLSYLMFPLVLFL
jgi:hypothetical protein